MRILRLPLVMELTGLPKSTLYHYIKQAKFPKPVRLGIRSVGWIKDDVDEWLRQCKRVGAF